MVESATDKNYRGVYRISTWECRRGNVLAQDVFDENGIILLAEDTMINEYIKNKLIKLDIGSIYIYDYNRGNLNKDITYDRLKEDHKKMVSDMKSMFHQLAAGDPVNHKIISSVCDRIYKNIENSHNIVKHMTENRNADEYTYEHSVDVAFYAMLIAKWLDLYPNEINDIIQAALLHDIGKAKIPEEILNKKGILTRKEFELMKDHTIFGYEMLEHNKEFNFNIKSGVLFHHERTDGSGYPLSLSKNGINFYARLLAIVDVFDAMVSDRPYKKRIVPFKIFEMFETVGLGMFDLVILKTFLTNLSVYLTGTKVLLSTGEIGEVVYIPLSKLTCPVIKAPRGYIDFTKERNIKIIGTK